MSLTLKLKLLGSPTFLINLFSFSPFPIGTSSFAMFGRLEIKLSNFFGLFFCSIIIWSLVYLKLFLIYQNFFFSLDLDKAFSCSRFSFLEIKSLFLLSILLNSFLSKSTFLSLNFFYIFLNFFVCLLC